MIRRLAGDYIHIDADEGGVKIRAGSNILFLNDDEWRELVYLLRIVGEANSDRPA